MEHLSDHFDDYKPAAKKQRIEISSDSESSLFSPTSTDDDDTLWSSAEDSKCVGEHQFQSIAEAYGNEIDGLGENDDTDDDDDLGDSAFCAICDDGGHLLLCDGPCMRSFHACKESASKCKSLGLVLEDVKKRETWYCRSCTHGQQQCFICGKLGKSTGEVKEVFVCDVALCGRFYHPQCLGEWKETERFSGIVDVPRFIQSVKEADGFCCPAHTCRRCGEAEEDSVDDSMKLAKCRRCPKAFHKACLPKPISFCKVDDKPIRAWDIGARLLIYCMQHKIIPELQTPHRNHLRWPEVPQGIRNRLKVPESSTSEQKQPRVMAKSKPGRDELKQPEVMRKVVPKGKVEDQQKQSKMMSEGKTERAQTRPIWKLDLTSVPPPVPPSDPEHKAVPVPSPTPSSPPKKKVVPMSPPGPSSDPQKSPISPRVPSFEFPNRVASRPPSPSFYQNRVGPEKMAAVRPIKKIHISREGQYARIKQLMQRAAQHVTMEGVKKTLAKISCYGENMHKDHGHRGEIQSTLHAGRKALDVLKNGGSIEHAKRLCPKDCVTKLLKTERTLRVFLAPLVHALRYTSFGRHFTQIEKLKEIVERIHPYINSGDMVVDFCCGTNDFSVLLNMKLKSRGKYCEFKNFDIHPPQDSFCFTRGDWFEQDGHGFAEARKLIIGLNPPFGVNASLADKFVLHALRFKPKLLILIVPPETMSFSKRYEGFQYELVWKDTDLLKGSAFYLPGSLDEKGNGEVKQWNNVPPPLFLWSTAEMFGKHEEIALRYNHVRVPPTNLLEGRNDRF